MTASGERSRFILDLPDPEAALALAVEAESTLHRLEALTGASLVLRGLQLVITGRSAQLERAAAVPLVLLARQLAPRRLFQARPHRACGSGESGTVGPVEILDGAVVGTVGRVG